MTHLYLIRHGQAVVNVNPIIGGMRGDTGLTPRGVEQAELLRDRLAATREIAAGVLISSTMPRARQTAQILAPALARDLCEDAAFCEMLPGEADGLTFEEYERRYGKFVFDPSRPLSPGGETWLTFVERTSAAFERITTEHAGQTIVVVCHGWVIESSFVHFFGLGRRDMPTLDFQVTNTSITHWQLHERGGRLRWGLGRYNDAVHLQAAVRWQRDEAGRDAEHTGVPLNEADTVLRIDRG
jgi:probable phosphoglycerate mutase